MGRLSVYNITGVLAALMTGQAAVAADFLYVPEMIEDQDLDLTLPAVSDINGKIEFYGGFTNPGAFGGRIAGSLSLPVGDRFGLQFDGAVAGSSAGMLWGGAIHAFTRDPSQYLLGVTGAVVRGPAGWLGVIGPEAELYHDQISIEAWAGVAGLNYDDPMLADLMGVFAIADVAYYVTDDWRLTVGGSYLLGEAGLHLGTEYLLRDYLDMPVSLTADFRATHTGAYSIMGGIKGYFGGDDSNKSLIRRHREDDPPNRPLSLFGAVGSLLVATAPTPPDLVCGEGQEPGFDEWEGQCVPSDPEEFCETILGGSWESNGETFFCDTGGGGGGAGGG